MVRLQRMLNGETSINRHGAWLLVCGREGLLPPSASPGCVRAGLGGQSPRRAPARDEADTGLGAGLAQQGSARSRRCSQPLRKAVPQLCSLTIPVSAPGSPYQGNSCPFQAQALALVLMQALLSPQRHPKNRALGGRG